VRSQTATHPSPASAECPTGAAPVRTVAPAHRPPTRGSSGGSATVACHLSAPQIGSAQAARRTAPARARSSPPRQPHPSIPQGRGAPPGDSGRPGGRPPFLPAAPTQSPTRPPNLDFPHPGPAPCRGIPELSPSHGPGAAHPWLRRGRRKRRAGFPVTPHYPNPALRATPRLRAAPLHNRRPMQTRGGHLPGPPKNTHPENL
jgi:hypothetical protein